MVSGGALLCRPFSLLIHSSKSLNLSIARHGGAPSSFSGGFGPRGTQKTGAERLFSAKALANDEAPDLRRLAETARISLTQQEVEDLGPKIQQVIGWFGQLQSVDLNQVEPGIRAATAAESEEGVNLREDVPFTFPKTDAIIEGIPSYDEPYVRVPRVLNKE